MLNSDNLLHLSGIILTILISVSVISYTNKLIFGGDKIKKSISINEIYDPDFNLNVTHVCIFSKNVHWTRYEDSDCYNKTLLQWYNPWLRHHLWSRFWEEVENKKRVKVGKAPEKSEEAEVEPATESAATTENPPPEKDEPEPRKMKENSSEFVYSLLVGFLLMSVLAACWEVFRDKVKRNEGAGAKAQERQCTLADFTINRHLRRETQQQAASHLSRQASLELTAKVTQKLIHQSSLDRAFPKINSEVISGKARRNSVPSSLIINIPSTDKLPGPNVPTTPLAFRSKRQSVDVTGEEASPEARKKSRHFIRRH